MKTLSVIVGTQFGSEGKGHITHQAIRGLLNYNEIEPGKHHVFSVRVGGPNAGHCVIDPKTGHKYAFRTVPVGAIYDQTRQYIAPGSEVDLDVLENEVRELLAQGHHPHIMIDGAATWLTPEHIQQEKDSDLNARTGSTAKGIGAARAERIWRKALTVEQAFKQNQEFRERFSTLAIEIAEANPEDGYLMIWGTENEPFFKNIFDSVHEDRAHLHVVIEGTQGYGLGMHGVHYPQATSNDTRAIDFMAMAGTNPWQFDRLAIVGATRTNPIRVAGNSGPLKGESTWEDLGQESERTTVTQKIRRVGEWDGALVARAVADGGVNSIALTMVDKIIPEVRDMDGTYHFDRLPLEVQDLINQVEADANCPVDMFTTSEHTAVRVTR